MKKNNSTYNNCPYCDFDFYHKHFGLYLAKPIGNGLGLAASPTGKKLEILLVHIEDKGQTVSCSSNTHTLKACPICQKKFISI